MYIHVDVHYIVYTFILSNTFHIPSAYLSYYNYSNDTVRPPHQFLEKSTTFRGSELRTPPGCGRSGVEVVSSGSRVTT